MSGGSERSLAELVEELTRRLEAGETIDLEGLAREHPELAGELRALVPALAAVDRFARGVESGETCGLGESGLLGTVDPDDGCAIGPDPALSQRGASGGSAPPREHRAGVLRRLRAGGSLLRHGVR